jgi:hypothetical protein
MHRDAFNIIRVVYNSVSSDIMGPGCRWCEDPNLHWNEAGTQFGPNAEQALPRWFRPTKRFIMYLKAILNIDFTVELPAADGATRQ